jgi:hypothetical protein
MNDIVGHRKHIDIIIDALESEVDGGRLQRVLLRGAAVRRISLDEGFRAPDACGAPQARQFAKLSQRTGPPESLVTFLQPPGSRARFSTPL